MIKVTTLITTLIKKLFKLFILEDTTNQKVIWEKVPSSCISEEERELILFDLINRLEHKIKIIK